MQKKYESRPVWPLVLMAVGVVIILGAIGGYFYFSSNQEALSTPTQAANISDPGSIERVSPADAYAASKEQKAVIVDLRSAEEYSTGHVAGALSIPLQDLPNRISELNPDDWIITY